MASSLFSNTIHVCFDSVLEMDNAGMVAMFRTLASSGLQEFLGCPSVIFETTLVEFFHNASVRDGLVVSTVHGQKVEILEEMFASTIKLPTEGLIDLHEVPQDAVLKARHDFSYDVKAGSFDAVTHERFFMMTAIFGGIKVNWSRLLFTFFKDMVTPGSRQGRGYGIQTCILLKNVPNLELGESKDFSPLKILTPKTIGRYIAINDKIAVEDVEDVSMVKKTPVKRTVSKKRPDVAAAAELVVKKKRTSKGKSDSSKDNMEIVHVPQEAVPLQTIEPTPAVPAEQPPVPKRKSKKRRLRLQKDSDNDEIVE
ncbi:mucin-2-like [Dorcoceras hygrometricum]|uniref:Mucin-2-like n=1 Tax=Dorcoceras hygrometricum TaxID=472368 RepID=A0A2Z7BRH6_9LAMI|nr:mucin-2-like [Dorcoceras hygrometricum]